MATELVMPKLGLTMAEGLIVGLLKKEGDKVEKGEGVLEIETEKLTNIVESPVDGTILRIVGEIGESLPIASVLAYIGDPDESVPDELVAAVSISADSIEPPKNSTQAPTVHELDKADVIQDFSQSGKRAKSSPAARALAKKYEIDYRSLKGSGPGGRIVKADIEEAVRSISAARQVQVSSLPYTGMRKAIGDSMLRSWTEAPMVTHHVKADVSELLALKNQLNKDLTEDKEKVGVTDLFVKIVAKTIAKYPIFGASLTDAGIQISNQVNIGVAVAVDKGLVVPVIRDVDRKDLFAVSKEVKGLIVKARSGMLEMDDLSGGTFTISNISSYNSVDFFTPIVNAPESAILGIGRTIETPVALDGEILIRPLVGLSFTFDHRVIDGAPAAEFLADLLKNMREPLRAVFER